MMNLSAPALSLCLAAASLLLSACDRFETGQKQAADDAVLGEFTRQSVPADHDERIRLPRTEAPLDLSITSEMLEHFIDEGDAVAAENQSQLQLQEKKPGDIQFKGRLLLETRENNLVPSVDGAMVEIEVKTRSL